jgi:hypothetical protein
MIKSSSRRCAARSAWDAVIFEARQALFRRANPKRELILVEKAFGETIDQTGNRLL